MCVCVFTCVEGGGGSARAAGLGTGVGPHAVQGAIRLALARAISSAVPESQQALQDADVLREDPRRKLPMIPGKKKHKKGKRWRRR